MIQLKIQPVSVKKKKNSLGFHTHHNIEKMIFSRTHPAS